MSEAPVSTPHIDVPPKDPRAAIVEALMALAAERRFDEITISEIAARAGVSLSAFRDAFPSKGAVLGGFSRRIDKIVLDGTTGDLAEEGPKDRLFDVLMRRIDAMAPYREALKGIVEWARREPVSAAALNSMAINSMRFMLEAAGISSEGPVGALKLQGLVIAWTRILDVWFADDDPGLAATMAELDKQLERGGTFIERLNSAYRMTSPLRALARAVVSGPRDVTERRRERPTTRDEGWDEPKAV